VTPRQVVLAARPQGAPRESDFAIRDVEEREPGDGEALVRNVFVSVDPYMRTRMSGIRTYVGPYDVEGPIDGGAVGRVVASNAPSLAEGDWVLSRLGWCEAGVVDAAHVRKLDPEAAPPSTALGVLGMPGLTAWVGLVDIAGVKEGEVLYVSGAAGAVGSTAAQVAKLKGLHVIGSAGSAEKVEWLRSLGIDAFDCAGGTLNLTLLPKHTNRLEIDLDGRVASVEHIGGRAVWHTSVRVPAAHGPAPCTFRIRPDGLLGTTVIEFVR
jgi:NADPH-dependent curcumin reductase CurA